MHRNVTAIYRTSEVAELVRTGLEDLGVPAHDIHVFHGTVTASDSAGTSAATGQGIAPTGSPAVDHEHPLHGASYLEIGDESSMSQFDRLHDLQLPEEDLRTYQHALRSGDHVVSVEVDEARLAKVQAVMRRPETEVHDIEHRATEFRDHDLIAHSAAEGRYTLSEEYRARRLTPGSEDRFSRVYERNRRLDRF